MRLIGSVAIVLAVQSCARSLDEAVVEVHRDNFVVAGNSGSDLNVLLRQSGVASKTVVTVRLDPNVPPSRLMETVNELESFGVENIHIEDQ